MTDKIVSFPPKTVANFEAVPSTEYESESPAFEKLAAVRTFVEFLEENLEDINHFIAGVELKNPDDSEDTRFQIYVSPISAKDFAMGLKLLEHSLFKSLDSDFVR